MIGFGGGYEGEIVGLVVDGCGCVVEFELGMGFGGGGGLKGVG